MVKLFLRESFSASIIIAVVILISTPLLIAYAFNVIPHYSHAYGGIMEIHNTSTAGGEEYVQLCPPTSPIYVNRTRLRLAYMNYLDGVSAVSFLLIGSITAYIIARPIEYRYFFIEATYGGGRLRMFLLRLSSAYMLGFISSLLGAVNLSGIMYVLNLYSGMNESFLYSLEILVLETIIAVAVASIVSLFTRSFSTSIFAILGFIALILILGTRYDPLTSIVLANRIVLKGEGVGLYVLTVLASITGSIWRADRIEY